jgi:glycosyltransferase involved in cell wall biosynthesis
MNFTLAAQRAGARNVLVTGGNSATLERSRAFTDPLKEAGVEVMSFPTLPFPPERPDRWGLSLPQLKWIARHVSEFDLIHIHGAWGLVLLSALTAASIRRIPIAVTAHESFTAFDIDDSRTPLRRREKLLLKSLYLRWATIFILGSHLEAEDSLQPPEMNRLRVVGDPLFDPDAPVPELRPRGESENFTLGFLGRIHPKKNLDLLVNALPEMPPRVRLVVAGDGPDADKVRRLIRARGLQGRVDWRGFVSPDQRVRFLDGVDVLAMPSIFESFGMSAAEAMLNGIPVIVSTRTGIAELIRRRGGGLIVGPTVEAIVGAVRQLDSARQSLADLGAQGQQAVCTELSYSTIGEALVEAYADAIQMGSADRNR